MRERIADLWRYAVASAFSFVFVIGATAFMHEVLDVSETLAPAIALVVALFLNFALLRYWVFPGQELPIGRQFAETAATSIAFRVLEYGVFLGLHLGLDVNYLVATGTSVCLSAVAKFFVYREIVFSRGRSVAGS
jgi:putative flippase GtrA